MTILAGRVGYVYGVTVDRKMNVYYSVGRSASIYDLSLQNVSLCGQAIGSTSAAQTLNFSIANGTTVGSIGILTSSSPGLDFAVGGSSTCVAAALTVDKPQPSTESEKPEPP